jgi:hypothetical protein
VLRFFIFKALENQKAALFSERGEGGEMARTKQVKWKTERKEQVQSMLRVVQEDFKEGRRKKKGEKTAPLRSAISNDQGGNPRCLRCGKRERPDSELMVCNYPHFKGDTRHCPPSPEQVECIDANKQSDREESVTETTATTVQSGKEEVFRIDEPYFCFPGCLTECDMCLEVVCTLPMHSLECKQCKRTICTPCQDEDCGSVVHGPKLTMWMCPICVEKHQQEEAEAKN